VFARVGDAQAKLQEFPLLATTKTVTEVPWVILASHGHYSHHKGPQLLALLASYGADFNSKYKIHLLGQEFYITPVGRIIIDAPYLGDLLPYYVKFGADLKHPLVLTAIDAAIKFYCSVENGDYYLNLLDKFLQGFNAYNTTASELNSDVASEAGRLDLGLE